MFLSGRFMVVSCYCLCFMQSCCNFMSKPEMFYLICFDCCRPSSHPSIHSQPFCCPTLFFHPSIIPSVMPTHTSINPNFSVSDTCNPSLLSINPSSYSLLIIQSFWHDSCCSCSWKMEVRSNWSPCQPPSFALLQPSPPKPPSLR